MNGIGPFTVPAAGGSVTADVTTNTSAVVVFNASSNNLSVSLGAQGVGRWLPAWTGDVFYPNSNFDGAVVMTTPTTATLTSAVLINRYNSGDAVKGTYPYSFVQAVSQLANQQTLVNDGNSNPVQVIESTSAGSPSSNLSMYNTGKVTFLGTDTGNYVVLFSVVPSVVGPNPANISIGAGQSITGIAGASFISTATSNSLRGTSFETQSTTNNFLHTVTIGNAGSPNITLNNNGNITATAPMTLLAGNQETGFCGAQGTVSGGGQAVGVGVNFKTVLTNVPTSLTFTVSGSNNFSSGPNSGFYTVYGCFMNATLAAAGNGFWFGKYVTSGNCIRAVDLITQTFDHHCDHCGNLRTGLPIHTDVVVMTDMGTEPGASMLAVSPCPACGSVENLNTNLSSAAELDTTPSSDGSTTYGEQAAFIRQIQGLLGLSLAS